MITRANVCLTYRGGLLGEENKKEMSKQNGESLATINEYLNAGGRILHKERISTSLGEEVSFILWRRDPNEPTEEQEPS